MVSTLAYINITVNGFERSNMPPDEYTTVTISEETAEKLTELVVHRI